MKKVFAWYSEWIDHRLSIMRSALAVLLLLTCSAASSLAQVKPDRDYLVYVLSESADKIALVRFGADGARVDRQIDTGDMPVDIDGPHGIAVSPDSRYAFISNEAVGAAPGKVDIYDLQALTRVADVPVGQQAGGIAFWKMEPAAR